LASYNGEKTCANKECTNSFADDRWGTIRAGQEGWFIQQDGTVWCPSHIPTWVSQWRHARKCEQVTKKNDKNEQKPLPKGPTGMYETRGGVPNATPSEQKPDESDDE
jgi:hypothetical protein